MPITYAANAEGAYLRVTWSGHVDATEFRRHLERMLQDPEALQYRRSLADLRTATLTMTGAEIDDAFRHTALPLLGDGSWTAAMLVSSAVNFGAARQFGAFSEGRVRCHVFQDEAQAMAWLRDQSQ